MVEKSHIATSLAISAAFSYAVSYPFTISFVVGVTLGSILPDIDHPKSFISRHSFGLGKVINKKFGHRGITHSLVTWAVLFTTLVLFLPSPFTLGVGLGYLLHIIEDYFSVSGVPLFLPFDQKRRKCPIYKTSDKIEKIIFISALLFLLFIFITDVNLRSTFIRSIFEF